jgi:hypothetical protein
MIASLSVSWSTFDRFKELKLLTCHDCGDFKKDWTFECLARSYCELTGEECEFYQDLYFAGYAYTSLELASLMMLWLFYMKVLLLFTGRYPGPKLTLLIPGLLMLIFHTLGILLWFIYSKAGLDCDSTDFKSRPDICIGRGPILALINSFLMIFVFILSTWSIYKEALPLRIEIHPGGFLWLSGRTWSKICLTLTTAYTFFLFASLSVTDWIHSDNYQGSLSRCKDCQEVEWLSWSCLKSEQCEINDSSSSCKEYKNLSKANEVHLGLQVVSMFLLAYFFQSITSLLNQTLHGPAFLNYLVPGCLSLTNLISILFWFLKSESKLVCSHSEPCGSLGPQLSIISNFFIFPSSLVFIVIFNKREEVQMSQTIDLRHYNSIALSKDASLNLDDANLVKSNLDETNLVKSNLDDTSLVKSN